MFLTVIVFLLVLGLLVIVHEFGHFIVAKKAGVKVEEFALGFPPRIYSYKKGETEYSINAIPLGGYVRMLGELEHSKDKRAFENQKPKVRFLISIAGVTMNLVLAWILLTIGFSVGMSPLVSSADSIPGKRLSTEIIIADVTKDSPAEKSGLKQKDIVVSGQVDGVVTKFNSLNEFVDYDKTNKDKTVLFTIKDSDNKESQKEIKLLNSDKGQLGVAIIERSIVRVPFYKAPYVALHETFAVFKLTFQFLGSFVTKLFSTGTFVEGVGGPVAIYAYTGLALKAGFMVLLQFVAILSINLALINILPFPALDGGRLVFIILEKFFGKRVVKERVENIIHTVGFALLILLMIAITYKDIVK